MQRRIFEIFLGAVVLVVAVNFGFKLFTAKESGAIFHYPIKVHFESAQGLKEQADVRLGGVKIGYIEDIDLNSNTLLAEVHIQIEGGIELPEDSLVQIASTGLLGNSFLKITPGQSAEKIAEGGMIHNSIAPVSLEDLLGRAIFALSNKS